MLLTTGSFILVYVLGMLAAVKLLPRGTWAWRGSIVALVAVIGLMALTGLYVLWALVIAGASLLYVWRRKVTGARTGTPVDSSAPPIRTAATDEPTTPATVG